MLSRVQAGGEALSLNDLSKRLGLIVGWEAGQRFTDDRAIDAALFELSTDTEPAPALDRCGNADE